MFTSAEEEMKYTTDFLATTVYPEFEDVNKIIGNDITLIAEYGEFNHEVLSSIWNNLGDKDLITLLGKKINKRGGFQALQANFYTLLAVLRQKLKCAKLDNECEMVIWYCIKSEVSRSWDGVGDWKN